MSKFLTEVIAAKSDLMVPKFSSVTISLVILSHNQAKVHGLTSEADKTVTLLKFKVLQRSIFISVVSEFGMSKVKKKKEKENLERKNQLRNKKKNLSQKVEMKKILTLTKLILLRSPENLHKWSALRMDKQAWVHPGKMKEINLSLFGKISL